MDYSRCRRGRADHLREGRSRCVIYGLHKDRARAESYGDREDTALDRIDRKVKITSDRGIQDFDACRRPNLSRAR